MALTAVASCNALSGVGLLRFDESPGVAGGGAAAGGASASVTVGSGGAISSTAGSGGGGAGASSSSGAGGSSGGGTGAAAGAGGATPTPVGTLYCNDKACAAGQICCHDLAVPAPFNDVCAAPGECPTGYGELWCGGPSNCPGEICCEGWVNSNSTGATCEPVCDPPDFTMCAGDPSVCGMEACNPSSTLGSGYGWCG